jgi:hypothetical protein
MQLRLKATGDQRKDSVPGTTLVSSKAHRSAHELADREGGSASTGRPRPACAADMARSRGVTAPSPAGPGLGVHRLLNAIYSTTLKA